MLKKAIWFLMPLALIFFFASGCFAPAQFGAPGRTGIRGVIVMPTNNCYLCDCSNPQVSEGEPATLAEVELQKEDGNVAAKVTADACGKYEVNDLTDSCYILYAKVQGGDARVKKGIYPLTGGTMNDVGEANYYTTAQVIIYEVAVATYGKDVVKCSDIPNFVPSQPLLEAVKSVLAECKDAQKDARVLNLAQQVATSYFGAPAGGGGGGGAGGGGTTGGGGEVPAVSYAISGVVFEDKNGNGQRDNGESGVASITVTLSGAGSGTTVSGSDGSYAFSGLGNGTYTVAISGYAAPYEPTTAASLSVTITGGNQSGKDFGLQKRYYIKGCVWVDLDSDGRRDEGEPGQANVTVNLSRNGSVVQTTKTDSNGCYTFMVTEDGTYVISIVPPAGYTSDPPPSSITVVISGNNSSGNDFRLYALTHSIAGKVRDKDTQAGVNGAKVSIYDNSWGWVADDTSESDGSYVFTGFVQGTYYVKVNTPYPSGYSGVEPAYRTVNLVDVNINGQDFDLVREPAKTYSISGHVFKDKKGGTKNVFDAGEGVNGVTVKLNPSFKSSIQWEVVTFGDGYYVFENLPAGSYSVEIQNPPNGFYVKSPSPPYYNITLASSIADKNFQLAKIQPEPTYSIQGFVIDQATNQKLNNVVVKLFDISNISNPVLLEGVLTGAGSLNKGEYKFDELPTGSYRVKVMLPDGYVDSYPNKYEFNNLNSNQTDKNFLLTKQIAATYCLKGKVTNSGGQPVAGIEVRLRQWNGSSFDPAGTDTTDSQGEYAFCNLLPGKYRVVVPTPQGGYPVVSPERYEKEIINTGFDKLDFVLSCSAQDPCCQTPSITKITLTPSCECPEGTQPKVACTDCVTPICAECNLKVEVTATNAIQYKYEFYIGGNQQPAATEGWTPSSTVTFDKNVIGSLCGSTGFRVKVYARNNCNQEVSQEATGQFSGRECQVYQNCCGYSFQNHGANWGKKEPNQNGWDVHIQGKVQGNVCEKTLKVVAKIYDNKGTKRGETTIDVGSNGEFNGWVVVGIENKPNNWKYELTIQDGSSSGTCPDKSTGKQKI